MEQIQQYQLGPWRICPRTNTISDNANTRSIDNKSMQVLLLLIQKQGQNVTKEYIFEHVWKNTVVSEDILSVAISKIRKALGDKARRPSFIKTLPGTGYCLLTKAQKIDSEEIEDAKTSQFSYFHLGILSVVFVIAFLSWYISHPTQERMDDTLSINSIAVLPLDDLSLQAENQYFSDGMSDTIISRLSRVDTLKIISRLSSFQYRDAYEPSKVGKDLQVDAIVDGSVQRSGEQVRINIGLLSTKDGGQLWARSFDGNLDDIFLLQDEIVKALEDYLRPKTSTTARLSQKINSQAYEWYLMGQYHWRQRNPTSLSKAVTYFEQSLALEPEYVPALVGLAVSFAHLHHFGDWSEEKAVEQALPPIEKALSLSPDSPEALAALGMILNLKAHFASDTKNLEDPLIQRANNAFKRSLALDDNATTHHWYSSLLKTMRNDSGVIVHMNKAIELNPLSASLKRSFSSYLAANGKPDSAQRMFQRAKVLEPDQLANIISSTHVFRFTKDSIIDLAKWQSANSDLFTHCSSHEYCEQLILAYASVGAQAEAESLLNNMTTKHQHFLQTLQLLGFGLNNQDQEVLKFFETLVSVRPKQYKARHNLATAQFRAEQYAKATETLMQLHPQWSDREPLSLGDINADNYRDLILYSAILRKLNNQKTATTILENVSNFLGQGNIYDKIQGQFSLAEIHAQLGNSQAAIEYLRNALNLGWVESYTHEWWSLYDNHLLRPLSSIPAFVDLLEQHKSDLEQFRIQVSRTSKI